MSEAPEKNPLELSDEEFLNMVAPPASEPEPEAPVGENTEAAAEGANEQTSPAEGQDTVSGSSTESGASTEAAASGQDTISAPAAGGDSVSGDPPADAENSLNYQELYSKVMAPFKANGKTIELKSPEEAVKLMQMGANYTRKLQELAPHRKVLTMLENNGLLDEDKLSFFIDLDKKNPEAIKKFIKDSGIDPMDIDVSAEPAYLEGNHKVSDQEVNFSAALDELSSTPEGKETLTKINTWDQASKQILWENPEAMSLLHAQREVGIFDRIAAEVERRTTLGDIPAGTPFLKAYKIVGDELTAAKAFDDLLSGTRTDTSTSAAPSPSPGQVDKAQSPEPVVTRAATPKPSVSNGDAAAAAATPRATPKSAKEFVNPLSMSDEEFMKLNHFEGRL